MAPGIPGQNARVLIVTQAHTAHPDGLIHQACLMSRLLKFAESQQNIDRVATVLGRPILVLGIVLVLLVAQHAT